MKRLSYKEICFILNVLAARSRDLQKTAASETEESNDAAENLLLCNNLINFFEKEQVAEATRSKKEAAENFDLDAVKKTVNEDHNS